MLQLDPAATALVVVDMQNDFVRQGAPLEVPDARDTIENHRRLLKGFRDRKRVVVFTRFIAGPGRTLIWNWSTVLAPPTCCCWPGFMRTYSDIEGPRDAAAVIDELAPLPTEYQIAKYNYGAFHRTNLLDCLQAQGVDTVVVTGTVTQICVDDTRVHSGGQRLRRGVLRPDVADDAAFRLLPGDDPPHSGCGRRPLQRKTDALPRRRLS